MAELQVIGQEMSDENLVIRQHLEDLTTKSQIIVYESQEAILFKNGQALDLFGAGRHTLETANIPLIKKFFSNLFGGKTPFPCDIFFVNKAKILDFIWGTDSPIDLDDPRYPMTIGVRANGQTGFRIVDSRRFVIEVVGMLSEYSVEALRKKVKGLMMGPVRECIAQAIDARGISILEITGHLTELSEMIEEKLNVQLADFGIRFEHFTLRSISASESDIEGLKAIRAEEFKRMKETDAEAYKLEKLSEARAKARAVEGYSYADERRFDILEGAAKNESAAGGMINMGVGFGMGAGIAQNFAGMAQGIFGAPAQQPAQPAAQGGEAPCPACGAPIPAGAKFCMNCGQARPVARFCPECGTKCQDGAKFCMNCGSKLG